MQVRIAEQCGFCPGVRNAIALARQTLQSKGSVYCLGPIIHNQDVVNELTSMGMKTVDSIDSISEGTVLIRSHGATKKQLQEIENKGLTVVDATCVLVKRVQKIAAELEKQGYQVVIIGDRQHPEVQAVVGFADHVQVIGSDEDLHNLNPHKKLGVICQTTQSPDHFAEMVARIIKNGFSELKVVNTLCRETMHRQSSAIELCRQVDVMFVLGGLHSANTRKLAELCKKCNPNTFHLQNWKELDIRILFGKRIAGVTAGASTPDGVVQEFVERLRQFDAPADSVCPNEK
jgi:(E)-4-hydroxy-3-methyl-but-2-enyl pyrophosphate reductase